MPRALATSALLLLCLAPLPARAGEKLRPMTVEDVMGVRHITEAAISPDGTQVLYVVSEVDQKQGVYKTGVWLVAATGRMPRKLTNGPKQDDTPRWAPDGQRVAFRSDRDGKPQVWVIAPSLGEATRLTDSKTGVRDFSWSADGRHIAYTAAQPKPASEVQREKERANVVVVDQAPPPAQLHVIAAGGGPSRQLTSGKLSVLNFSWSPDGKQIAYSAGPSGKLADLFHTDLHVVAVQSGKSRTLLKRDGLDTLPKWSPDGKQIAFLSGDGKLDWLADLAVCVMPSAGGEPRNVSKKLDGLTFAGSEFYGWSPDNRTLRLAVDTRATRQLFSLSVPDGEVKTLTGGQRVHDKFSFSADGQRFACVVDDPTSPREVHAGTVGEQKPTRATFTNPQLLGVALGKVEVLRWKSADGLEVEGLLIKPAGYQQGRRYPLLTYIHGGPALQFAQAFSVYPPGPPQASRYPIHVLAGQGYLIFCPNPRGSAGYGQKFRQANVKDWGVGDFKDIMTGVDHLIAQGLADPERLGIMGWSYGGYMTSWAITQTDRFKAASTGAGVTNLFSMYGQTDIPRFMEGYFGDVPWNQRELYAKHSAMTHVGKVKTPTLIQHGEKDDRVPLAQSQELYGALKRRGVPVEFVVYPRQGHNPSEPRLQADVLRRNVDWFNRWLKP